jgi:hypothetical protein
MKQLVQNLGDQFNLPIDDIKDLNLDKFVESAIEVEAGRLPTLRVFTHIHFINQITFAAAKCCTDSIAGHADKSSRW